LPVQRPHGIRGCCDLRNEVLALQGSESQGTNDARDRNLVPADLPAIAAVWRWIFPGIDTGEFFFQGLRLLIVVRQLGDLENSSSRARHHYIVCQLLFIKDYEVSDGETATLYFSPDR